MGKAWVVLEGIDDEADAGGASGVVAAAAVPAWDTFCMILSSGR